MIEPPVPCLIEDDRLLDNHYGMNTVTSLFDKEFAEELNSVITPDSHVYDIGPAYMHPEYIDFQTKEGNQLIKVACEELDKLELSTTYDTITPTTLLVP